MRRFAQRMVQGGLRLLVSLAIAGLVGSAGSAEELVSGLAVGQPADQFLVKDCTGPAAGKTLCYYCRYADRPVVALFVHELSDELADLVQRIDQSVDRHQSQRLAAFVVLIGKDTPALEKRLKQVARTQRLRHTPLTIYRDKREKLSDIYRLTPQAAVTALVWQDRKVTVNRAYPTSQLTSAQMQLLLTAMETTLEQ